MSGFFNINAPVPGSSLSNNTPEEVDTTASAGTDTEASRSDHVHDLMYDVPAGAVSFDTTPTGIADAEGKVYWDPDFGTLSLVMKGGNVVLPIGQKSGAEVKNKTGSTITKGQVVQFDDASGGNIEVAVAVNDGTINPKLYFGIAAEDILDDEEGFIVATGYIRGLDTSAYTVGDLLYLDDTTPGLLTATIPSKPAFIKPLAVVTRDDDPAGVIYVRIPDGATLNETFDVDTTGASTGDLLTYDGTNWLSSPAPAEYGDGDGFRPHPVPPTGSWILGWSPGVGSSSVPIPLLSATPIVFEDTVAVDRIALSISSVAGMTGTYTYEFALFDGDATGPDALISNYGTVAVTNATTPGIISITISETLTGGTIYWLVFGQTRDTGTGPALTVTTGITKSFLGMNQSGASLGASGLVTISTGVIPAVDFSSTSLFSTTSVTKVFLRRAT
jgi:hypothetical protein